MLAMGFAPPGCQRLAGQGEGIGLPGGLGSQHPGHHLAEPAVGIKPGIGIRPVQMQLPGVPGALLTYQ